MACARACSPGGSCCSTSGGAGCPSDPSLPSPTAHSVSGKPLRRSGPRRAASAVGCRQCPQQTAEEPAAQGQTRPSGDLDGRDQKGGAGRLRRLCRDLRDQVRQGGRVPRKGPRRTARLLRFSRRALEALTDHEPNREHVRDDPPSHGALERLPVEQDRARPDFQAGPGRREELATARRSSPLAEGDPRYHVHQWDRGRQPRRSTRCRLTPPVTNFRQYLPALYRKVQIGGGRRRSAPLSRRTSAQWLVLHVRCWFTPEQHRLKNLALSPCGEYDTAHVTRSACCATRFCHEPTRASLGQRSGMPSLCLSYDEDQMTTRNDTNDQTKAADEAARTARTVTDEAARVGEQTARASADLARRSTETARETFQAGLDTANETFRRMTDQVNQVLGFNGPQAEELTRQVSQNLQAVSQASTVLARGAQEVSHEVFGLVQDRAQQNADAVNRIVKTRSVQDFVAVQSELVRDGIWQVIEINKRIAEVSLRIAEEAARIIETQANQNAKQVRRAA